MAKLLTLNEVQDLLEDSPEFVGWAVKYLTIKDRLSTYTHASAVTGILDYWMLENELPFYERGKLRCDEDIEKSVIYPDDKGDYQAGMESLLNTWKINPQELVALIQQEGFPHPLSIDDAHSEADDMMNKSIYTRRVNSLHNTLGLKDKLDGFKTVKEIFKTVSSEDAALWGKNYATFDREFWQPYCRETGYRRRKESGQ